MDILFWARKISNDCVETTKGISQDRFYIVNLKTTEYIVYFFSCYQPSIVREREIIIIIMIIKQQKYYQGRNVLGAEMTRGRSVG